MLDISTDMGIQASLYSTNKKKKFLKLLRKQKRYKDKNNSTENMKNQDEAKFLSHNKKSSLKRERERTKIWGGVGEEIIK